MSTIRIEFDPDILLRAKLEKVVEETGVTMEFAVREAIVNFLSSEGFKNPEGEESSCS